MQAVTLSVPQLTYQSIADIWNMGGYTNAQVKCESRRNSEQDKKSY